MVKELWDGQVMLGDSGRGTIPSIKGRWTPGHRPKPKRKVGSSSKHPFETVCWFYGMCKSEGVIEHGLELNMFCRLEILEMRIWRVRQ